VETGIIIASLSQALQCIIVASKLFQQIASDQLIPKLNWFAVMTNNEPKRALLIVYIISGCLCLIGSLDLIAPVLTMCFLLMYAILNLACLLLTILQTPSWRPRGIHKQRWKLFYIIASGCGFILSIVLMFNLVWYWAIVVWIIFFALYTYVSCKGN
jgi:amino acid transporter